MLVPRLRIIADDLSGAAECAAALARASRQAAPLVLSGEFPVDGSWSADTDSRALAASVAADSASQAVRRAAGRGTEPVLLFKKIDSTLRGNVAAELRATLADPGFVQAAVVCPSLPAQGRTLLGGVLHVHGQLQVDHAGKAVDVVRLLAAAEALPVLLRPSAGAGPDGVARELAAAIEAGARIVVVDALGDADLLRLARALLLARPTGRLLGVGAAGLANALAEQLLSPGGEDAPAPEPSGRDGPLLMVIGSFNAVTARQVDELAREPDVHLIRLDASLWLAGNRILADHIARAEARAENGQAVVLAVTGGVPQRSSRELVRCMAAAAGAMIRGASTLVLTGGDTARAVLDCLGIERLQVHGEIEPGICLCRESDHSPVFATKAGGFGDVGSLVRVLRYFRPTQTHPYRS